MVTATIIPGDSGTNGTKVLTPDGELHHIESMTVHFVPDDFIRAEVNILCDVTTMNGVSLEVWMNHPYTDERIRVSSITTAEGEVIEFCK